MNSIEQIVVDYLETEHFTVYMQIPESLLRPADTPPAFVVVQKTGSGMNGKLMEATIAIQSYAGTLLTASNLNISVIESMLDLVSDKKVAKVSLNSDYEFTDTSTGWPRYQAVFDIVYYQ